MVCLMDISLGQGAHKQEDQKCNVGTMRGCRRKTAQTMRSWFVSCIALTFERQASLTQAAGVYSFPALLIV
jgi:hypothetical protein